MRWMAKAECHPPKVQCRQSKPTPWLNAIDSKQTVRNPLRSLRFCRKVFLVVCVVGRHHAVVSSVLNLQLDGLVAACTGREAVSDFARDDAPAVIVVFMNSSTQLVDLYHSQLVERHLITPDMLALSCYIPCHRSKQWSWLSVWCSIALAMCQSFFRERSPQFAST